MNRYIFAIFVIGFVLMGSGKNVSANSSSNAPLLKTISYEDPINPFVLPPKESQKQDVLLYNGAGADTSNWQNIELLLKARNYSYRIVNSQEISQMSLDDMDRFRMFIFPGGSGGTIYRSISEEARLRIRKAVQDRGMGYVGFCAGAWVGVGLEANTDATANYGFAVAYGRQLKLFRVGATNVAVVDVKFANSSQRNLVVWGAPYTPEWRNGVVARYSNGRPAISQIKSGKGFVIVTGPHPEAPQDWRDEAGHDADGLDYDVAYELIEAALKKTPLPSI